MFWYWHIDDLYKALIAMAAGIILGLERERKDKSAGLKTIAIITLGSALFTILSINFGQADHESTRIASYIVSGIGFLGAGVIFKDGVSVSGLTTASIIWIAAAIGMAIGFGEIWLGLIFLGLTFLLIYLGGIFNAAFPVVSFTRVLVFCLHKNDAGLRSEIIRAIKTYVNRIEEKKIKAEGDKTYIFLEVNIKRGKLAGLENYLLHKKEIISFEL